MGKRGERKEGEKSGDTDKAVREGVGSMEGGAVVLERFVHGDHCFGCVFDNRIDPSAREANIGCG